MAARDLMSVSQFNFSSYRRDQSQGSSDCPPDLEWHMPALELFTIKARELGRTVLDLLWTHSSSPTFFSTAMPQSSLKLLYTSALLWTTVASGIASAATCPDYTQFASTPQGNNSVGPLALPYMRPSPECRTFTSPMVEKVIQDMKSRLKDPDIARLFENTFPSTLDTTVKYFSPEQNLAFIITGDITAQWLRDTANQFAHLQPLTPKDKNLQTLVKAVINNEARYITQYPYCGSFQPPPESGLAPSHNAHADNVAVNPPVNNQTVFECKFEIDSLCGFIKLSRAYWQNTKDTSFVNENWMSAIGQIFRVIIEQSQPTFDDNFNVISYYNWTGLAGSLSPRVPNHGNGEPKAFTGLVGTSHRPSDDLSVYAFLTPANAMLSVELGHLADLLEAVKLHQNATFARKWSKTIKDAIYQHTLTDDVFAYEINGYGARYVMDDANVPSLLSLPYLGFLDKNDAQYVKTRNLLLSKRNPYYSAGPAFFGIGGPHVDDVHPWPMSLITSIFGTDDDATILRDLYTIANNTNGLGLIHESIDIHNGTSYTRPWFAWANSYFAEMLLDLAKRKPGLIFKNNIPYDISKDA